MNVWCYYAPFHGHDEENVMTGTTEENASREAEMWPDRIYYFSEAVK